MCFFGGCRRDNEPFYPADDNIGSIKDSIKNNFIASYRVYFSLAKKKKKKYSSLVEINWNLIGDEKWKLIHFFAIWNFKSKSWQKITQNVDTEKWIWRINKKERIEVGFDGQFSNEYIKKIFSEAKQTRSKIRKKVTTAGVVNLLVKLCHVRRNKY